MKGLFFKKFTTVGLGCFCVLATFTSSLFAGGVSTGLRASTQGIGLEFTGSLTNNFNLRVGANYLKFGKTLTKSGNEFDFDLVLQNINLLVDWHVLGGSFRVTGGAVIDKNYLNGVASPANTYSIGDSVFTNDEVGTLTANIKYRDVSPYIGIGWGNPMTGDSPWTFMVDLGIVLIGKANVDLASTGGTLSNNATLLAELVKEEANVRDDLDGLQVYPVVSITVTYRY